MSGAASQTGVGILGATPLNYDAICLLHPFQNLQKFLHPKSTIFSSNLDELEDWSWWEVGGGNTPSLPVVPSLHDVIANHLWRHL